MNSDEPGGRQDPVKYYGPWTWIIGLCAGAGMIWIMFAFADGF